MVGLDGGLREHGGEDVGCWEGDIDGVGRKGVGCGRCEVAPAPVLLVLLRLLLSLSLPL